MFESMTIRWAFVLMGGCATVLALVPFVAFIWGPKIRANSKYSRMLMEAEHQALEKERAQRQGLGMNTAAAEDLEGDADFVKHGEQRV